MIFQAQTNSALAEKSGPPPVSRGLGQRKCACGGAVGPTGECDGCREKRLALSRRSRSRIEPPKAPPSSGQSWGTNQTLDEPRFSHDFSRVRVHPFADAARDPGQPLRAPIADRVARGGAADLAGVRVHTGPASQRAADALGANAFTVGRHIYFGAGQFQPHTAAGERLIAHELAHTAQYRGVTSDRWPSRVSTPGDASETEARTAADSWVAGGDFVPPSRQDVAIHRDKKADGRKVFLEEGFTGRETEDQARLMAAAKGWVVEGALRWNGRNWVGESVRKGTGSEQAVAQVQLDLSQLGDLGQGLGVGDDLAESFGEQSVYTGEKPEPGPKFRPGDSTPGDAEQTEGKEGEAEGDKGSKEESQGTEGTGTGTGANELDPLTALASFMLNPDSLSETHKNTTGKSGSPAGGIGFLTGPLAKILTVVVAAFSFFTGPVLKLLGKMKGAAKKLMGSIFSRFRRLIGKTPKALPPGAPSPPPTPPVTEPPVDTGGIPEAIPAEQSGEITRKIANPGAAGGALAEGEVIGGYKVLGTRQVVGDTVERRIAGLSRIGGPTVDTRPINEFFNLLMDDARAAGASQLRITGEFIGNKNVLRMRGIVEKFGGTVRRIDAITNEIVIPL